MVNTGPVAYAGGPNWGRANNVNHVLERNRALFPERAALKWVRSRVFDTWDGVRTLPHESITYEDFASQSARLATGLKHAQIHKGDRVIILLHMSVELYLAVCAVMRIGAISVFLDEWAKHQLSSCVHQAEPTALIGSETILSAVPDLRDTCLRIAVGGRSTEYYSDFARLLDTNEETRIEPVALGTPALITYTTGSSGTPKGAVRTHGFLAAQHSALDECIPYLENDVDLPTFPIFSLNNLASGIASVLPAINLAVPSAKDARILVSQMLSEKVTSCTFAPALLGRVTEYCNENSIELLQVRRIVTGGAPIDREVFRCLKKIAPGASAVALYGSTEAEPIAFIEADELLNDTSAGDGVNVGNIVRGLETKIITIHRGDIELDDQGWEKWEVPEGETGELIVSGAHVNQEYYKNSEAFRRNR
jgi:acyl-CoA synthetase (AMP-forming)/AMP-acid ligase II